MTQPPLIFRAIAALRNGFQLHGPKFPFVVLHRFGLYGFRKCCGPRTFELAGRTHRYLIHPFILDNERAVEVPVVRDFLQGRSGQILELGNVLSNYIAFPHEVVDKYERAPGVINEDIVSFAPGKTYDAIVTISTLEHVGWDEQPRDPEKLPRAIERLKSLLKPTGELIATMPLGYNPNLDRLIREGRTGFPEVQYLKRISANNKWRQASLEEVAQTQFGTPYGCANAIMIGIARGTPA